MANAPDNSRDEVLKRMLKTPPKPHVGSKKPKPMRDKSVKQAPAKATD